MQKKKILIVSLIMVLVVLTCGVAVMWSPKKTSNNKNDTKTLKYKELDVVATNEYYKTELKGINATLDGKEAYSLDYNLSLPCKNGGKLEKQKQLSGITVAGLLYGYPYVSPEELNVESEDEARLATQFAIWRLAQIKGVDDAKSLEYIFDMDNIKPKDRYEDYIDRVKAAAQVIVDKAIEKPYYTNPKFNIIDGAAKIVLINDKEMVVGPYLLAGEYYEVDSIQVSLEGAPEVAVLCDKDGNEKKAFNNNEEVYIKLTQDVGKCTFHLRADAEGGHYIAFSYGTGDEDDNKQNFCALERIEDKLSGIIEIQLPNVLQDEQSEDAGKLKIISVDEDQEAVIAGITYEILDEQMNVLQTFVSDENGELISDELAAGKYYFREISGPDNICIDSTEREFIIDESASVEVYVVRHYYARAKIQFGCTDMAGEPISGAVFEIYNLNNEMVTTVETDSDGIGLSDYILLGEYNYKCISAPDDVMVDDELYDFKLSVNKQILECWIEFEGK